MYFAVSDVEPLKNYQILLTFKNGEQKIFNMKPYLETGIFCELIDEKIFKTVRVQFDTVEWANGADIDPETLYFEGKSIKVAG